MIRVRFAPSPTGHLHLGNIRTALFNWLFAKREGGQFILRIEDTDRERSAEEYEKSQLEDLAWMGIRWDEGPGVGGAYEPYRQSERLGIYRDYLKRLFDEGKAYYCYVTEEETEEMKYHAKLEKRPPRFDNRGRTFTKEEIEKRKARGIQPTVRFRIDNPKLKFHDLIRGDVSFNLDDMQGDFVLFRRDGMPTFHLAVCIDDCLMKITHVIRGEDHLSNTPKHILLMEAMGFKPPQYGHLSLVHGPGGEPLSKRLESVSVRKFREQGYMPEALANYIALLGWSPGEDREIISKEELLHLFDLSKVSKSASAFDPHKLDWVNGEHFRRLSDEEFAKRALAYLKVGARSPRLESGGATPPLPYDETLLHRMLPIFKDNVERFNQLPERLEVLNDPSDYEKRETLQTEEAKEVLKAAIVVLNEISVGAGLKPAPPLDFDAFIADLKPRVKAKGKELFHPLRLALTGKVQGPELKRIFPVLGIDNVKNRFKRALAGKD